MASDSSNKPRPRKFSIKIKELEEKISTISTDLQAAQFERATLERNAKAKELDSNNRISILEAELAAARSAISPAYHQPIAIQIEKLDSKVSYVLHAVQDLAMVTHSDTPLLEGYLTAL